MAGGVSYVLNVGGGIVAENVTTGGPSFLTSLYIVGAEPLPDPCRQDEQQYGESLGKIHDTPGIIAAGQRVHGVGMARVISV
jgi:hypothetical protein